MTAPLGPPPLGDVAADPEQSPRRAYFYIAVAAVLLVMGGWVYVLFFYDPGLLIDELADKEFPVAAEQVCAAAVSELEELPPAGQAANATDRADTVERSNVILTAMLDDLEPLVPTDPPNVQKGVSEWLADWRTYVQDRRDYVDNLRQDPEARFFESPKGTTSKGVTRAIDSFAQVNEMNSCTTPADVS